MMHHSSTKCRSTKMSCSLISHRVEGRTHTLEAVLGLQVLHTRIQECVTGGRWCLQHSEKRREENKGDTTKGEWTPNSLKAVPRDSSSMTYPNCDCKGYPIKPYQHKARIPIQVHKGGNMAGGSLSQPICVAEGAAGQAITSITEHGHLAHRDSALDSCRSPPRYHRSSMDAHQTRQLTAKLPRPLGSSGKTHTSPPNVFKVQITSGQLSFIT